MRRMVLLVTAVAVMAAMMLVMAMPALAFHNTLPPISEECGKGKCPGLGEDENKGATMNNGPPNGKGVGDDRNEACEKRGFCIGTFNN